MVVERENDEVVIRLPASLMPIEEIQNLLDYLAFREVTSKSQATEEDVDELVRLVKQGRGEKARARLRK